jgi:hypothetical protein
MRKILMSILSADGKISSKRLITLLAFVLMGFGFIMNLILKYTIDASLFESMQWVVLGGLGFTASEKFSGLNKPNDDEPTLN